MAAEVQGLDELKRRFLGVTKALRARVLRNALSAGARLVRDEAKRNVPVMQSFMKTPYRTPGTVKRAIRVRTSRMDRRAGNVGVFVNVKPLKGGSAKNPRDPYYWRWLEFGTKHMTKRPFMQEGAKKLGDALKEFEKSIAKWMSGVNKGGIIK